MKDLKGLSERVRSAIITHEETERTYVCHHCHDKGVTLYQRKSKSCGYETTHSAPCTYCERGAAVTRGRADGRIEGRKMGEPPNRRLGGF